MNKKSQDFSMEDAMRIANSPAGQRIAEVLRELDQGKMEQVAQRASAGDMESARKMLSELLDAEKSQKLKDSLGE